jgi:16S rRNA (uracil1498-N3)-methyltransferase
MRSKRKQRFYCQPVQEGEGEIILSGNTAHHLTKVLRFKPGDILTVFDGSGFEWDAKILDKKRNAVVVKLLTKSKPIVESPLKITLMQSVSRSQRMDLAIQKATELGVHRIVPILTNNSVVQLDRKYAKKKMDHWKNIIINAAEQSGRVSLPLIEEPTQLDETLLHLYKNEYALFLDTTGTTDLGSKKVSNITIAIGPEGGFTEVEKNMADQAGYHIVKTGPRLLRTETAPIMAISILQYLYGDLAN